jgi:beta-mannosidase
MWENRGRKDIHSVADPDVPSVPAAVPGSVQLALLKAGVIEDWNIGLNSRRCEWVENRQWVYQAALPDKWFAAGKQVRLRCLGLDYIGEVCVNGQVAGEFLGSFVPHVFDLTPHLKENDNILQISFLPPPRWLGQSGYTSRMRE